MSELVKVGAGDTLEDLAAEINAEHRACEAAVASAVEHAIRAGEMLMEAKEQAGHGGWLPWLQDHFEGSADTAQVYIRLARNREFLLDAKTERARFSSIRGAVTELKREDREKRRREQEARQARWSEEHREHQREFFERVKAGEVSIPLEMRVSHTYDFDERPDHLMEDDPPMLCVVEEVMWLRGGGYGSFVGLPDWRDENRCWFLWDALPLEPGDEDLLERLRGPLRAHKAVDLDISADALDEPPTRALSWDGATLRLPTGSWEARLVRGTPWAWWAWDSMDGGEILRTADPGLFKAEELCSRALVARESYSGPRPPRWADARDLETALLEDLEAVRGRLQTDKPDLTDPRVVHEIGERVLPDYVRCRPQWKRFAAFVENGAA